MDALEELLISKGLTLNDLIPQHISKQINPYEKPKVIPKVINIDDIENLVSVIIPTYNRFFFLMNTINSVKNQTYKPIEIIVVNDGSTEKQYSKYNWEKNGITIINLEQNSKKRFGYGCVGYVRNQGIKIARGKYIAFCDDDDIWFPRKIEYQLSMMEKLKCKMSSTEGLTGIGIFNASKKYKLYNRGKMNYLKMIFQKKKSNALKKGIPKKIGLKIMKIHNIMICSSVVIEKSILDKIRGMPHKRRGQDYQCWLKALKYTNSAYVDYPCVYYDAGHGKGKNH